ncbi:MAG: hypothetical protein L3J82_09540 [Planctomycetes bacterium]|nr:hypothetical protein [Planctomycetota bacterium]
MIIMLKVLSIATICTVCTFNVVAQDAPEPPVKEPATEPAKPEPTPPAPPESTPEPTPEPKPTPAPEPEPKESDGPESSFTDPFEHGQPLTMKVPEKIKQAMIDQGKDATRLRVYFEEDKKDVGIKVEYGDESTEIPVIFAAFVKDRCDCELPYNIWSTRKNGFVDLTFDVKSRPTKLDNLGVEIIHTHLIGETENEIAIFEVPVPEGDNPWEDMRLPGAKPGINRYTLRLTYKQGEKTTIVKGFSHWVIVQAPPMFSFKNGVECEATRKSINGQTTLSSVVSFTGSFRLHDGLSVDEMFLRITRKGRRNVNLRGLSPDMRRMVAKEKAAAGWQEVGRSRLTEGQITGLQNIEIDGQDVSFSFQHSLAITSRVLPLLEDWEYRFELLHKNATKPIAVWSGKIDLHIKEASKIAAAEMTVSTTGMSKPMVVKFKQD